jgi:hypothetical protein
MPVPIGAVYDSPSRSRARGNTDADPQPERVEKVGDRAN